METNREACPFCKADNMPQYTQYLQHIGNHMVEIAFWIFYNHTSSPYTTSIPQVNSPMPSVATIETKEEWYPETPILDYSRRFETAFPEQRGEYDWANLEAKINREFFYHIQLSRTIQGLLQSPNFLRLRPGPPQPLPLSNLTPLPRALRVRKCRKSARKAQSVACFR